MHVRAPWHPEVSAEVAPVEVVIDPGQAFGTGAHATTRLCLELLLELEPSGPLVDLGCGSGVLAIAAAKLGWAPVLGVDHEPASPSQATRENARVNGVDVAGPPPRPPARRPGAGRPDGPRQPAAARCCGGWRPTASPGRRRARSSRAACSSPRRDEIAAAFAAHGLREAGRRTEGEWAALLLTSAGRGRGAPRPRAAR